MIRPPIANHQSEIKDGLAEAAGVEPAHATRDGLANRCHTVRRRLRNWRKARESNPTRTKPPQFSRLLDSLNCRAFQVKVGQVVGRDAQI